MTLGVRIADAHPAFHVAQLNVARWRVKSDDPRNAPFFEAIDPINALADTAPGFVWRWDESPTDAARARLFGDDVLVNLSVWRSLDHLREFTFSGEHAAMMRRRREFFDPWGQGPSTVLFWVPADQHPQLVDAAAALRRLTVSGPGPDVFSFATPFLPDQVTGLPSMFQTIDTAESRARAGRPPVVGYVDVVDLTDVNERHGNTVADELLRELTVRIRGAVDPSVYLGRGLDDEFLLLADPGTDPEQLCSTVEQQVSAQPLRLRDGSAVPIRVEVVAAPWDGSAGATLNPMLATLGLRSLDRRTGLVV
jgi:GGDEF domain-containing protein